MKHVFKRVAAVDVLDDGYRLRLHFDDGKVRDVDFEPVLHGEMYAPLRKWEFFKQVTVDDEAGTVVWPNGADFDPDMLYRWEEYVDAFSAQMKKTCQSDQTISECL